MFFSCFIMVIFVVIVVFLQFFFSGFIFFGFTALVLVHFPAYVGFLKVEVACL